MAGHRADLLAALVREALKVPIGERGKWIRGRCLGDAALAARLRDAIPTEPGDTPAPSPLLKPLESVPESARSIGPYALRGVLGEGAFGIVYLAEQSEPLSRRVALKVLKPRVGGHEVVARFERERRLLARFDHPGIAHVLDAGVTDDGRPWFALEFVRGLPLLAHCDEARLSIDARLRLFEEVCRAVQHAHQNGVLHRDLKPGNILVSPGQPGDGTPPWGLPKVIDFGIAEAVDDNATGTSAPTAVPRPPDHEPLGVTVGTLPYMSPEQALGLELDARTDIYSLGVILHQLLTGVLPLDKVDGEDALAFIQRLRSFEPAPPSQVVRSMVASKAREVAAMRSTTPARLVHELRGDLDWIVVRCLAKDRARRYDSAADLAADLRRHFDSRPIEAAPPSVLYRIDRFVRRHRRATAAAIVSFATLVIAIVLVTLALLAAQRARDAERIAREHAERAVVEATEARAGAERASNEATDALGALISLITSISLDRSASGAATTPDAILEAAREQLIAPFRERPRAQAQVRLALAKALVSLDHPRAAEREVAAAVALLGTLGAAGDAAMIEALRTQATIDEQRERYDAAADALDRAFDLEQRQPPSDAAMTASLWLDRARLAIVRGDGTAARRAITEARRDMARIGDAASRRPLESSASFFDAQALAIDGRWKEALVAIEPNLAFNKAMMPSHWWVAESSAVEAAALIGLGRVDEGRAILVDAEPALRRALPPGGSPRRVIGAIVAAAFQAQRLDADAAHWRALAAPR